MEESDQPQKEEKHPTKALTDQPQEEFIAEKARPSQPEKHEKVPPAKGDD